MQQKERIQYLLLRYMEGMAAERERNELAFFLQQEGDDAAWEELMEELFATQEAMENYRPADWQPMLDELVKQNRQLTIKRIPVWRKMAIAASILLVTGLTGYLLFVNKKNTGIVQTTVNKDVPAPQTNRATITLANGEKVYLDSAGNGSLTMQAGVDVLKLADGKIVYRESSIGNLPAGRQGRELVYNTLTNPRGSKVIDMTLADGSQVWLNAGSSVTFPVTFTGAERKVSITGEAYFEVAHDAGKPFKVAKGDMEVTVLGTHFNVNAYDDEEAIKVTLLEGSVMVKSESPQAGKSEVIINPGQQAIRTSNFQLRTSDNVDLAQVIAWKNGFFNFNNVDLKSMMKQVERWYDIQVQYEGNIPRRTFGGELSRDLSLSEILQTLNEMKIKFRLEGRTLTVSDN